MNEIRRSEFEKLEMEIVKLRDSIRHKKEKISEARRSLKGLFAHDVRSEIKNLEKKLERLRKKLDDLNK